ncbi:hypothetical protein NDU88_005169 [Pleurodeles waltl]|uniref:Uncharacterized protein n=1 Tax=Pleurodeles waltl TaxID=8319 RepID=A0AAV7L8P7_PLEWA|nr:hypothetical protein NDU88_005169 [Pleurodeles waltl]
MRRADGGAGRGPPRQGSHRLPPVASGRKRPRGATSARVRRSKSDDEEFILVPLHSPAQTKHWLCAC